MTGAIVLLMFLFVLGIGISTILYVSKNSTEFNLMAGLSLFVYMVFAFITLACIVDSLSIY
jgi:hypothetical protein